MRKHFKCNVSEPMLIEHNGKHYQLTRLEPLAQKTRLETRITEYVFHLQHDEYIYLTIVGDEDQPLAQGARKGWYLVESLSKAEADIEIDLLSKFTAEHQ